MTAELTCQYQGCSVSFLSGIAGMAQLTQMKENIISNLYNASKRTILPFWQALSIILSHKNFLEHEFVVQFVSSYWWLLSSPPNQEFSCQSHTAIVIMLSLSVFTQIKEYSIRQTRTYSCGYCRNFHIILLSCWDFCNIRLWTHIYWRNKILFSKTFHFLTVPFNFRNHQWKHSLRSY